MHDPASTRPETESPRGPRILHLLGSLEVGGKERAALRLAGCGRQEGQDHRLLLFDVPLRGKPLDLDPGAVPVAFLRRQPGLDVAFPWRVARLLRRQQIDVLHAHNDTAIFYGALAATFVATQRTGFVGTFHTRPHHGGTIARRLTRLAAARAGQIVAVSDELERSLKRAGWIASSQTIWNGVDLAKFQADGAVGCWRRRLGLSPDELLVAMVARLHPIKRQVDLVEAARNLGPASRCVVVLVGNGPDRGRVRDWLATTPHLRWVEHIDDVAPFLREVDIFVLCSDHEAAPLALLEAMACKRAIVATRVGGIPSMLRGEDSACGLLVPPRRPERLAEALRVLANDAELRKELGRRAAKRARAFSFDAEWRAYSSLYAQAAKEEFQVTLAAG